MLSDSFDSSSYLEEIMELKLVINIFIFGVVFLGSHIVKGQQEATCGEVFLSSQGTIAYKDSRAVSPNERCVWTIRARDAKSYRIHYTLRTSSDDGGLIATCISSTGGSNITLFNRDLVGTGETHLPNNCPVLILTYFTGSRPENQHGFHFGWTSQDGPAQQYSYNSRHYVLTPSTTELRHLKYPEARGESYSNNELSTFTFLPYEKLQRDGISTVVNFVPDSQGLEGSCIDHLTVYKFWAWEGYQRVSQLCASNEFGIVASSDIRLVVFRSDVSVVGTGFRLFYNVMPCSL